MRIEKHTRNMLKLFIYFSKCDDVTFKAVQASSSKLAVPSCDR